MAEWHPIRVVSRRTGLSPHVIRAWEKRYGAVEPKRTPTNRRVYSTEDVERLLLLRRATMAGRSIGQIASLSTTELAAMLKEDEAAQQRSRVVAPPGSTTTVEGEDILAASLEAVTRLDGRSLQSQLDRASLALSRSALLEQVVVPLMHTLGERWHDGTMRASHEHLATAVVRSFVGNMNGAFNIAPTAPEIMVTTPAGQLHEVGALLAAATAAMDGWRATYLGPSLPAEEIAGAVELKQASALGLSIIYPTDDPHLAGELRRLRQLLPDTPILMGGRGSAAYQQVLDQIHALRVSDLKELRIRLGEIRH